MRKGIALSPREEALPLAGGPIGELLHGDASPVRGKSSAFAGCLAQLLRGSCTVFARLLRSLCTASARLPHGLCAAPAHLLRGFRTVFAQLLRSLCTASARSLRGFRAVSARLPVQLLQSVCAFFALCSGGEAEGGDGAVILHGAAGFEALEDLAAHGVQLLGVEGGELLGEESPYRMRAPWS